MGIKLIVAPSSAIFILVRFKEHHLNKYNYHQTEGLNSCRFAYTDTAKKSHDILFEQLKMRRDGRVLLFYFIHVFFVDDPFRFFLSFQKKMISHNFSKVFKIIIHFSSIPFVF